MSEEAKREYTNVELTAIKTVLECGLTVADSDLCTWIVRDRGEYCVDGTGTEPIEEEFDIDDAAIEYFLEMTHRFAPI